MGGALLAILLGPLAAFLVMTTVIAAQALCLQDGGVIAAGANIFNIGTLTVFSGYGLFHLLAGDGVAGRRSTVAAFVAGWISLVISASACALQLALSGAIPLKVGLPAMAGYHTLIGLIEGGLTAGVLSLVLKARPDLVRRPEEARLKPADWLGASVLVAVPALILVLAGSSSLPDPLEKLLESASPETGGSILAEPSRWGAWCQGASGRWMSELPTSRAPWPCRRIANWQWVIANWPSADASADSCLQARRPARQNLAKGRGWPDAPRHGCPVARGCSEP